MGEPNALADALTVRDALARHYVAHGLPADGGANDPWFHVRMGRIRLPLPNPPARRRAVLFHDVNHVVTGYNTTFGDGEMAIAAFEVAAGCGHFAIVWFINLCVFAFGFVSRPRMVFRAFVRGRQAVSIYGRPPSPVALETTTVGELRRHLRVDSDPTLLGWSDYSSFVAWGLVGLVVLLSLPLLVLASFWFGFHALAR